MNVTAGGGSSITLPVLIFLGVDPVMANGTNRLAIMLQNASASASFRNEKIYQSKYTLIYALLTIPGSILGSIYATGISNEAFKNALGIVLIGVMITVILPRSKQVIEEFLSEIGFLGLYIPGFYSWILRGIYTGWHWFYDNCSYPTHTPN